MSNVGWDKLRAGWSIHLGEFRGREVENELEFTTTGKCVYNSFEGFDLTAFKVCIWNGKSRLSKKIGGTHGSQLLFLRRVYLLWWRLPHLDYILEGAVRLKVAPRLPS